MYSDNQTLCSCPVYMPDGSIMPELLTEQEAIVFLRLDAEKNASRTLKYYRDKGHLRGLKIGRNFLYPKCELLDFIAMAQVNINCIKPVLGNGATNRVSCMCGSKV